jgi:hypothetical protein
VDFVGPANPGHVSCTILQVKVVPRAFAARNPTRAKQKAGIGRRGGFTAAERPSNPSLLQNIPASKLDSFSAGNA